MSKTIDQICNHLEFLGYKIEKEIANKEGDKDFYIASSPSKYRFTFHEFYSNLILFKMSLTTEKKQSNEMSHAINQANKLMNFAKVYYEVGDDEFVVLRYEIIYMGDYNKELFGQFFTIFEKDQNISIGIKIFDEAFTA